MSKPEDIPQDVWEFCERWCSDLNLDDSRLHVISRALLAAKAEGLPMLDNCGKYLAQDNAGQWHYINHAGTWQGCPPPFPLTEERKAPSGWKWQMVPDYPVGQIVGACICGSWPGGECLKCPPASDVNTAHKNSEVQ